LESWQYFTGQDIKANSILPSGEYALRLEAKPGGFKSSVDFFDPWFVYPPATPVDAMVIPRTFGKNT